MNGLYLHSAFQGIIIGAIHKALHKPGFMNSCSCSCTDGGYDLAERQL